MTPIFIVFLALVTIALFLAYAAIPMEIEYVYAAFEIEDVAGLEGALQLEHHRLARGAFLEEDDDKRFLVVLHVALAKIPLVNHKMPSVVITSMVEPIEAGDVMTGYVIHRYLQPHGTRAMFEDITDFGDIQVEMSENGPAHAPTHRTITAKAVVDGRVVLDACWQSDLRRPSKRLATDRFGSRSGWVSTITGARNNVYSPVATPEVLACDTIRCETALPDFSAFVNPRPVAAVTHRPGALFRWYIRVFRIVFDRLFRSHPHL